MSTLELPPRRYTKGQELTIRRNRTSLEILLQMGFPKLRAEKALAATGDKGVQLACDWLLSHVRDPTLDENRQREYTLYLCPLGPLQQEFLDFWQKSFKECGWNRAHNYFPHITLCSFFQASNSMVSLLSHTVKNISEKYSSLLEKLEFDYFSSVKFVGLFVMESYAKVLKKLMNDFVEEMKKSNINVELYTKQLHISLAYQFAADKRSKLESLAKNVNIHLPARWDLRLYSRDRNMDKLQVHKVLYTYIPRVTDELELCDRDYIFVKESELETSTDGWYEGTSWMTGCSGMFPGAYTERSAETETWVMHSRAGDSLKRAKEDCYGPLPDVATSHSQSSSSSSSMTTSRDKGDDDSLTKQHKGRHQAVSPLTGTSPKGPRQLFVVRHGERVDFTFGKNWIQCCFNNAGNYIRYDLNMPGSVAKRKGGPQSFSQDSPITVQGHFQARLLGEAMYEKEIEISHVYASPSLRCVETASSILEGMKLDKEINIEPGLFEWLSWYQESLPDFMSLAELRDAGYPVNQSYKPVWSVSKFNTNETVEHFYERCCLVTKEILKKHEHQGGSLLFVSHGINLDTCTRRLVGQPCRSLNAFHEIIQKIPYCAVAAAQEATVVRDTWYLIEPPVLPFAHTSNHRYNWTLLTQPTIL
ncbi:hypothetical protein HELRODRAFT_186383 [Helobdella robusta]|uniref:Protein UBASH3A homolog n=1 Tax=Helobdella robusta TaxID=6412 RepID=T1FNY9_HELRO|nr:hypothetical protein HELRODRAFT_186383 [Helobdella robusta]ESO06362.1 hypothetical protein HELRODRAFT_186383 [Helobdella robusta]